MSDKITELKNLLRENIDSTPERLAIFFKTDAGSYAAHDRFMGIRAPTLRKIAKQFSFLTLNDLETLLNSNINEERLLALIILTHKYKKDKLQNKEVIYQFYMKNLKHVNNWNLVDSSAHLIIGAHLWDKDREPLIKLAKSKIMWERRIAMVSTWHFIRQNDLEWTFKIAEFLQNDHHDLIHKAVGWMLREAGKRDQNALINFLNQHASNMPRTMLRYSIEKFPEEQRKFYLLK